jgi:hypothetical protein
MKLFRLIIICVAIIGISLSYAYGAEEQRLVKVIVPPGTEKEEWVSVISRDAAVASSSIVGIKIDTPVQEIDANLQKALFIVQKMRKSVEPYGIAVDSFSLNIGFPPSITVNFKFKD